LIAYEICTAPLQVFNPQLNTIARVLGWASPVYWTFDILANFFSGYYDEHGITEVKQKKVWRIYLKNWFIIDVSTVIVDYCSLFVQQYEQEAEGLVTFGRVVRILRFTRLIRVLKIHNRLLSSIYRMRSNASLIILDMGKVFICISVLCHFVACGWYGMGQVSGGMGSRANWLDEHAVLNRSFGYRYTLCLHWALTQFTPASMEVYPTSTAERTYALLIDLCAIVCFSCLLEP